MLQIKLEDSILTLYSFWGIIGWTVSYIYIICHIQEKQLKRKVYKILVIAIMIAIAGARILWVIVNMCVEKRVPVLKDFVNGGLVFYGGMLPIIVLIWLIFPLSDMIKYQDIFIIAIPLFHGFARIGCFFAGCCFGKNYFPIQLLESFFCFIIFFILNYKKNDSRYKEKMAISYLVLYAVIRFFLEFLRGDEVRGIWFGLSTSQYISSIIMVIVFIKIILQMKGKDE